MLPRKQFSLVNGYHLLFTFAEPMPGVTYPLLKSVREQDRERKNVCMGGKKNRCDCERGINNAVWLNWGRGSGVVVLVELETA